VINGLGGDDLIRPGVGADTIFAGAGSDTVSYVEALQGVRVSLVTGLGELGTAQGDKIDGIENIVGSAFADTLTGDSLANQLTGGAGDDTLTAGGGNDTVIGGDGKDLATLGAGDDLFPWTFTDDSDAIDGQDGFDRLSFGVSASAEIISLAGNAGQVRLTRDVGSNLLGLTSMELIELRTSGGADQVHVGNMEGTGLQQVLIDLELGGPSSAGD
jgi:Ca2+-binding RTX toxin-like protein